MAAKGALLSVLSRPLLVRKVLPATGSLQGSIGRSWRWYSTGDDLEKAKQSLNILTEDPGNEAKLKLYGLYKQATLGQCMTKQPGMLDMVGRAKWNAWNSLADMPQEKATAEYVQFVEELVAPVEGRGGGAGGESTPASQSSEETGSTTSDGGDVVITTSKNGVRTIRLNRPQKKNALHNEMYDELASALDAAAKDDSVRLVVTTGTGDYYCSGNDLSNFTKFSPTPENIKKTALEAEQRLLRFVDAFINFPKPLVAALNGPAVGISVTVLGLYDFVYAKESATFHTPFTQIAQSPEGCSSYLFPIIMGHAKASEVLLLNRKLTAKEAFDRNLVTQVFSDDEFDKMVEEKLKYMSSLPPQSFQCSKVLVREANRQTLLDVNRKECAELVERWTHPELIEAIMAFFNRKN